MSDVKLRPGRDDSRHARRQMEEVSAAKSDINNVAVFTKLIKKAEEVTQSAL
ncbi:hypothetical protein MJ904_08745 [Massilia sp. MB5]|uniref:hypothetical protein n=1 Tax=unclassified Massilia TaxID=2609279 RepID=UPI000A4E6C94|nr:MULTISPECIES: hypothetical protein [unclassified Massilia]UMR32240.1 hypothetical protein MJ904_08745 [Massilia sp. MB5]